MIAGIGVDIVDIAAFRDQVEDLASTFVEGTFTVDERRVAQERPGGPAVHLAARYAAKEAFIKAWSVSNWEAPPVVMPVDMHDIEVISDRFGRPALRISGAIAAAFEEHSPWRAHVSLSHDGPSAIAMVVLERGDDGGTA